jgi:hypothetical protein
MMSFTCGIAAGLQIDDPVFIPPLETGLETIGGLQYTGEVDGGGGDLDFFHMQLPVMSNQMNNSGLTNGNQVSSYGSLSAQGYPRPVECDYKDTSSWPKFQVFGKFF